MNYYEILNIEITSSKQEIKKSYRKMAMKWHPDRNNNSKEAEDMFKIIKEAYETLSNDSARFWYDREMKETFKSSFTNNTKETKNTSSNTSNDSDNQKEQKENNSQHNDDYSNDKREKQEERQSKQSNYSDKKDKHTEDEKNANAFKNSHQQKDPFSSSFEYFEWKKKYPFANFYEYNLKIADDLAILGGTINFFYNFHGKEINIKVNIRPKFHSETILDVVLNENDILLIKISILDNPNKHLDIYSQISIDIFSALNGIMTSIVTSSGEHHISIPPLSKDGDNLTFYGLGRKGDFFIGNLYIKLHVYYPKYLSDEQKILLQELSHLQRNRDTNLFSKIFNIFKEGYYHIRKPKK